MRKRVRNGTGASDARSEMICTVQKGTGARSMAHYEQVVLETSTQFECTNPDDNNEILTLAPLLCPEPYNFS